MEFFNECDMWKVNIYYVKDVLNALLPVFLDFRTLGKKPYTFFGLAKNVVKKKFFERKNVVYYLMHQTPMCNVVNCAGTWSSQVTP